MAIRVCIADDHKIIREGLRYLIEENKDCEVVGEAEDGLSAIRMVKSLLPDIAIMDITMPDLNGIEATRHIVQKTKGVKVIALTMHSDPEYVEEMLKAGASAFILKQNAFEEVTRAMASVLKNHIYLSSDITSGVLEKRLSGEGTNGRPGGLGSLTSRERQVLQMLSEGKSTKEIARLLGVSAKTVETHRQHITEKLKTSSVAELTKHAIRGGLTSLDL